MMSRPPPGYERDVRPLFRAKDRSSMLFLFDLWRYEDVRAHAEAIAAATDAGDMPCDGSWSAEQIHLFRAWADGEFQP